MKLRMALRIPTLRFLCDEQNTALPDLGCYYNYPYKHHELFKNDNYFIAKQSSSKSGYGIVTLFATMSQTVYDDSMMTGSKEWSMGSLLAES
jgi:hypothetical protein